MALRFLPCPECRTTPDSSTVLYHSKDRKSIVWDCPQCQKRVSRPIPADASVKRSPPKPLPANPAPLVKAPATPRLPDPPIEAPGSEELPLVDPHQELIATIEETHREIRRATRKIRFSIGLILATLWLVILVIVWFLVRLIMAFSAAADALR